MAPNFGQIFVLAGETREWVTEVALFTFATGRRPLAIIVGSLEIFHVIGFHCIVFIIELLDL